MAKLTVTPEKIQNGWMITVAGEIDLSSADAFYDTVFAAYQSAALPLTFDCKDLTFIDSTALGAFVKINRLAAANGHSVTVRAAKNNVKKLFVICALDKVFEFED